MDDHINTRLPLRTLIRVRRLELRLTQANVAEVLRTEPEAVSNWERGERRIDFDKVPQLARILKLNEQELCKRWIAEFHALVYTIMFPASSANATTAPDG